MRAKVVLALSRGGSFGEFKMTRLAPLLANKRCVFGCGGLCVCTVGPCLCLCTAHCGLSPPSTPPFPLLLAAHSRSRPFNTASAASCSGFRTRFIIAEDTASELDIGFLLDAGGIVVANASALPAVVERYVRGPASDRDVIAARGHAAFLAMPAWSTMAPCVNELLLARGCEAVPLPPQLVQRT